MGVPLWLPLKPGTAVDTDMVDTVLDTAMVDTVARDPLKLKPMPGMAVDTVMVDMEVMVMEVMGDADMVDTVAREKPKLNQKLMLKPITVTATLDTDTVPDTVLELTDTVTDTVDTALDTDTAVDTDTKHLSNQLTKETILYKIMPLQLPKRVNTTSTRNKCQSFIDKDNSKNEREF